jgi:hypothetical protein
MKAQNCETHQYTNMFSMLLTFPCQISCVFCTRFLSWYIYWHRPPNKSRDSHTKIAHVTIGLFGGKPARYSPKFFRLLRQVCRLTRKPKFRATPPQIHASENLKYWQVSTTRNIIYSRWFLKFSANVARSITLSEWSIC